jgi:tRNA(Ile)-lysidine synthase
MTSASSVEPLDTRRKTKLRIENRPAALGSDQTRLRRARIQFVEKFDLGRVKLPLVVRFRGAGDRFMPLGLRAEKKVGKFLTAAQVPQQVRQKLLIIADSEKIIWVWPIRISEQAKITGETRQILRLQIQEEKQI